MLAALSPASLARASARRPWVTVGVWLLAVALSVAAAMALLGDSLTTNNGFTSKPEAILANDLITERFFPPGPQNVTEILYIHSDTLTVDDPAYRDFVTAAHQTITGLGRDVIPDGISYFQVGLDAMVSLDRHATGVVFTLIDDYPDRNNRATYLDTVVSLADPRFDLFPIRAPGSSRPEMVIVESTVHSVDSPEFRQFVEDLFHDIVALGRNVVGGAATYYAAGDASLVSADRTATLIPVILNGRARLPELRAIVAAAEAAAPDFTVSITGNASVDRDFNEISERDLSHGELAFGLPAAIIVLVLVFGAVVAAVVPLLSAAAAIAIALGLAALVGTTTDLSLFLVNMVFMMGLAVGIDYGLFIIARFREERANGLDVEAAIAKAGATASRAVLFSGITVVLALVGLLLVPTTIFYSLGLGAILVVLASIAASLTLLPAVLRLLGDRINRLRIPFVSRPGDRRSGRLWESIATGVMKAPVLFLVLAAGLLLALASPVLDLRTGASGVSYFPDSFESKRGFELLQEKFAAGVVTPTHILIDGPVDDPAVQAAIATLKDRIDADPAFGPITEQVNAARDTTWLRTPVTTGDAASDAALTAVKRLRTDYIPAAFAGVPARALVTGDTAGNLDWFAVADAAAPLVFPFVLVLSFILLMLVFRSIVVPVSAIIMNLLSVGAAYGLLVLVFQRGVGADLLGFQQVSAVEAWIPVFLFSVLFGLSMDYHVFLLSRIRERFTETHDNTGAIVFGVRSTGRLITGAALIMVAVFAGFASGDLVMFQQVGFGLGIAVLLDATIVRSVLVPATMRLLGDANWYLPRFLHWLPHLNIEGADHPRQAEPRPRPAPAE